MPRSRFVVAVTALLLLLAACIDPRETDLGAREEGNGSPSGLASHVLTEADLPSEYEGGPQDAAIADSGGQDRFNDFCADLSDVKRMFPPREEALAAFTKGEPTPTSAYFLAQTLSRYENEEVASDAFQFVADGIGRCTEFDRSAEEGRLTGTFTVRSFPTLGDDTFAAHVEATATAHDATLDLVGDMVVVRQGDKLMLILAFGFGSIESSESELEEIARKAHDNL